LTTDYYQCLLFTNVANDRSHSRFIKTGPNTGNLMRHCKSFHKKSLDGIRELISKSPKESVKDVVEQYILKQRIPNGSLDVLIARKKNANIRLECALFIWMLDAQIPFDNFDNPLFKDVIRGIGEKVASTSTVVASYLDAFYKYAIETQINFLKECPSFMVSFDSFTKHKFFCLI